MVWKLSLLREKDVIDVCSGRRVGYLSDLELCPDGRAAAILVSPRFLGGKGLVRVPWGEIACIGEDAILVRLPENPGREEKSGGGKRGLFGL